MAHNKKRRNSGGKKDEKSLAGPRFQGGQLNIPGIPPGALIEISRSYSSPYPPPEQAEGLERLVPGAAERMFEMAEKSQNHVMGMDKARVGIAYTTVVLLMVALGGGIFLAYIKAWWPSYILLGAFSATAIWNTVLGLFKKK